MSERMKNNGHIISKLFRNSVISIILAAIATMVGIVIDGIVIGRFWGRTVWRHTDWLLLS